MKSLFLALALVVTAASLRAQSAPASPALSPGTSTPGADGPRQATTFAVTGQVLDSADRSGVPSATVALLRLPDSTRVGAQLTDVEGRFGFRGLRPGRYRLVIRMLGYKLATRGLTITDAPVTLPPIILKPGELTTQEVQIVARAIPVQISGDTATFNAAAFKTTRDASAEDLIAKMPGIQIQGGQVTAQGEQVQRVLIDGRPAFDNDPAAALRNLPAEVVDRVSVFDDRTDASRFSGVNDGQRVRTLNITTRSDRRNGTFGRAYAGGGITRNDQGVYNVGGSINRFNGPLRITLLAQANDINQQNFGIEDILSSQGLGGAFGGRGGAQVFRAGGGGGGGGGFFVGGGGGRGGQFFGGGAGQGPIGQFLVGQSAGISETQALGLNLSQQWGTTLAEGTVTKLTGSYFFNRNSNLNDERTNRAFVLEQNAGQTYDETSRSSSLSNTHRLNLRLELDPDTLNSFLATFRGNIQDNDTRQNVRGDTRTLTSPLNLTSNLSDNLSDGYNLNGSLLYRRRLGRPGRTVAINANGSANRGDGNGRLDATNQFFLPVDTTDRLIQLNQQRQDGWSAGGQLTYTEPLTATSQVLFSLQSTYRENDSRREVTDGLTGSPRFGRLDTTLSNTFFSTSVSHQGELGYNLTKGKHTLTARLGWGWTELRNNQTFPQAGQLDLRFYNLLPTLIYRYAGQGGKSWNVVYRLNPSLPTVTQLQEVVDNSNPLAPVVGNASLRQQLQHFLFFRYQGASIAQGSFFTVGVIGQLTEDYIGNRSTLLTEPSTINGFLIRPGVQLTRPENLDDAYSLRTFITYARPVNKIKSNASFFGSINYTSNPSIVNDSKNRSNNLSLTGRLSLTSNISENLDFTVSSGSTWNDVQNTFAITANNRYWQQNSSARVDWRFGKTKAWLLQSDVTHTYFDGLTQGFNPNFFLWNGAFGRKIFKDQQGEIKLSVFDLLTQNVSVNRNVTETYVEDVSNVVLQRYVMLTFTWFIRRFKAGESTPPPVPTGPPAGVIR